ncbi:MAG: NAD(P)-dependent alcohol dehydrogenase [Bacteroidetes bacterium]|nr:NAD(P)-dependent alcohol dehydrogenase [Bacteroidota bacterium]
MKAVCYHRYGAPGQLALADVPIPALKPDHVLVRVKAASINSWDDDMLKGHTFIIRVISGWRKPRYTILGSDVAGVVEAVGSACKDWKPGDEVMGDIASAGFGSFAEFVAVPEHLLARKPSSISFREAAALPQAGLLAIQGLRHHRDVQAGDRVLINGAGGGVGPIAISYAISKGAKVTAVDRSEKFDMLRSLGVDEVVDFTTTDYTRRGKQYDKILDVIAHRTPSDYLRALAPGGIFTMIGGSMGSLFFQIVLIEPLLSKFRSRKLGIMGYRVTRAGVEELTRLYESGTIKAVIDDRSFSLANLRAAFEYFESGTFKGKIVIEVNN